MTTVNLEDALVRVQKQRKLYQSTLDGHYTHLESIAKEISECASSEEMWNYIDLLEEIRSVTYRLRRSARRNRAEVKDNYDDSMRVTMAGTKNAVGSYAEREAKYQLQHITQYKCLNNLERMVEDLDEFSWYLEGRIQWVMDRYRWLRDNEKNH